jgi:hypothetical protein
VSHIYKSTFIDAKMQCYPAGRRGHQAPRAHMTGR